MVGLDRRRREAKGEEGEEEEAVGWQKEVVRVQGIGGEFFDLDVGLWIVDFVFLILRKLDLANEIRRTERYYLYYCW